LLPKKKKTQKEKGGEGKKRPANTAPSDRTRGLTRCPKKAGKKKKRKMPDRSQKAPARNLLLMLQTSMEGKPEHQKGRRDRRGGGKERKAVPRLYLLEKRGEKKGKEGKKERGSRGHTSFLLPSSAEKKKEKEEKAASTVVRAVRVGKEKEGRKRKKGARARRRRETRKRKSRDTKAAASASQLLLQGRKKGGGRKRGSRPPLPSRA